MTGFVSEKVSFQSQLNFHVDNEGLMLYKISDNVVYNVLRTAFRENSFAVLRSYQQYFPNVFGGDVKPVSDVMKNTLISAEMKDGTKNKLTLSTFVEVVQGSDLKTIVAGRVGEYVPFVFRQVSNEEEIMEKVSKDARKTGTEVGFSGSYFSNKKMIFDN